MSAGIGGIVSLISGLAGGMGGSSGGGKSVTQNPTSSAYGGSGTGSTLTGVLQPNLDFNANPIFNFGGGGGDLVIYALLGVAVVLIIFHRRT